MSPDRRRYPFDCAYARDIVSRYFQEIAARGETFGQVDRWNCTGGPYTRGYCQAPDYNYVPFQWSYINWTP